MKHWMFNCKDVSKKVSESLDRKLPLHHRAMIRMHLMMCRFCWRFRKQMLILRELSQVTDLPSESLDPAFALSTEARARIKNAMKSVLE